MKCSIEGCTAPAYNRRGWCSKHYQRWRKTGDPLTTRSGRTRDEWQDHVANFWRMVDVGEPDECWPWTGGGDRYGKIKVRRMSVSAHRFAWQVANGPIPDGMSVLHTCDNPPCCNPSHLFLGTNSDNMRDMVTKGRRPRNAKGQFS